MNEITLDNCAMEPIHIPGSIQSHGAMLVFDADGSLRFASGNANALLGIATVLGAGVARQQLPGPIVAQIAAWLVNSATEFESFEVALQGAEADVIAHRNSDALLIVEFEVRDVSAVSVASFALLAHKAIERIMRQKDLDELLGVSVTEVRKITGFDRVMAYRFRHDDSGEVVRESKREGLSSWEGHRYPSGDIPAQARKLYVLNTLRLIADVGSPVIAVREADTTRSVPLDMSFCTLRSVSPIHIEYLRNMGVAASLSVSVVIDGRLWGMIACHHNAPRLVAHGVRMACRVLGQVLSVSIAGLETAGLARRALASAGMLSEIGVRARAADDLLAGITFGNPNPANLINADATVCFWGGQAKVCTGAISPTAIAALAHALGSAQTDRIISASIGASNGAVAAAVAAAIAPFCGILAICFDVGHRGWVVWLRAEQVEQVRWAGKPGKVVRIGPNGPRLTPRGSFDEWLENARGSSVPWERGDIAAADALRSELTLIAGAHAIEIDRTRIELLAALGHDLREPLHSISMAAEILQRKQVDGAELGARIQTSSGRMSRLVTQILDMSMLQLTNGISILREPFDLCALLREVVSDARFSYPETEVRLLAPGTRAVFGDRDRLAQVLSNLLSNARHHGTIGTPITVFARPAGPRVMFGVSNAGKAIPLDERDQLFSAFKPASLHNARNRSGLGLGLYIASEIVKAHEGKLLLECADGMVTFTADVSDQT
jgi:chemotaxis family two-component system sensor kinase Cph1